MRHDPTTCFDPANGGTISGGNIAASDSRGTEAATKAGGGMKSLEEIKQDIQAKIPGVAVTVEGTSLIVPKERWIDVAKFLREDASYELDYLSCVTGVDYKEYLEAVYHLYSIEKKEGSVTVKVRTDRDTGEIPSVTPIWRSAEFQEREAYDLVGIRFTGHPDLRRILMWEGFQHHPLRKDYVQDNQDRPPEEF